MLLSKETPPRELDTESACHGNEELKEKGDMEYGEKQRWSQSKVIGAMSLPAKKLNETRRLGRRMLPTSKATEGIKGQVRLRLPKLIMRTRRVEGCLRVGTRSSALDGVLHTVLGTREAYPWGTPVRNFLTAIPASRDTICRRLITKTIRRGDLKCGEEE